MKKIHFGITGSVIYTIIGAWVTISNLIKKEALNSKDYNYEFSIFEQIGDAFEKLLLNFINFFFGIPSLLAGLSAGILSCIALHLYNKNYTETIACKTLSTISISILASVAALQTAIFLLIILA